MVIVLPVPVAVTVPPPVAEKRGARAGADSVSVPVKLIVAPVLLLSEIPVPWSVMSPPKLTVPPVRLAIDTECPVLPVTLRVGEVQVCRCRR